MLNNDYKSNKNLRFNILTAFIYIIGIILILQLFNLQIIHGEEYRQQSNSRLTREMVVEAPRGKILDRNGTVIATNKMGFSITLYKTNITTESLNNTLLNLAEVLEKNGDTYTDTFPISLNPIKFTFEDDEDKSKEKKWKKKNKLDEDSTPAECLNEFVAKYKITNMTEEQARKVIGLRYQISQEGYSSSKYFSVSKNVSRQTVLEIAEQSDKFPGVNIVVEPIREYVAGNLASHVVGYVGKISEKELETKKSEGYSSNDLIGKAGMESVLEKYLRGEKGVKQIEMSASGILIGQSNIKDAVAGSDVVLTIDAKLQEVAQNALKENIEKIKNGGFAQQYDAQGGAVVVMDVKNGEILALASYPDYNPEDYINGLSQENWNKYNDSETKPMFNRAIQGAYAPGSTFKMVSAIAALESEVTTINETILTKGRYDKGHKPTCWVYTDQNKVTHGLLDVTGALKVSCNYYFYEMGYRMGIDNIAKYAKYFGLGSKTGIELPGEASGTLASKDVKKDETWYLSDTLSAVIGQSYNNFTPIQMAKYISILANGGNKVSPTLIKSVIKSDGVEVSQEEIRQYTNSKLGISEEDDEDINISQETLDAVYEGMRSVTGDAGGTAYNIFKNFDIEVAGKTGSAEAGKNVNAWFVGFAPYDEPEIAVVVIVENGGHGNYTAEVVLNIMEEYFKINDEEIVEDMQQDSMGVTLN